MNAPAAPATPFHRRSVFVPVVAITLVVVAVVAVVAGVASTPTWLAATVVVAVIALLGIPHGALDHVVAASIGRGRFSLPRFVAGYVGLMALVALVWVVAPTVALAAFLAVSVHHFGQSDLAYLGLGGWRQPVVQVSRGLLLIGLPLLAHLDDVAPLVERLGVGDPSSWTGLVESAPWWCTAIVVQHVVVLAVLAAPVPREEWVTVVVLTSLFVVADPLIGFAVYFGLWHSVAHLLVLGETVGSGPSPMREVARAAVPLSAVSIAALAVAGAAVSAAGRTDLVLPLVFVGVSMLTVPHLVVVERLWRRRTIERRAGRAETART